MSDLSDASSHFSFGCLAFSLLERKDGGQMNNLENLEPCVQHGRVAQSVALMCRMYNIVFFFQLKELMMDFSDTFFAAHGRHMYM